MENMTRKRLQQTVEDFLRRKGDGYITTSYATSDVTAFLEEYASLRSKELQERLDKCEGALKQIYNDSISISDRIMRKQIQDLSWSALESAGEATKENKETD